MPFVVSFCYVHINIVFSLTKHKFFLCPPKTDTPNRSFTRKPQFHSQTAVSLANRSITRKPQCHTPKPQQKIATDFKSATNRSQKSQQILKEPQTAPQNHDKF